MKKTLARRRATWVAVLSLFGLMLMTNLYGCEPSSLGESLEAVLDTELAPGAALPEPTKPSPPAYHQIPPFHEYLSELGGPFKTGAEVTETCTDCHDEVADSFIETVHWKWSAPSPGIAGHEGESTNGKMNMLNNFLIAVPSNEGTCTGCHVGFGWDDKEFDFEDGAGIDCLVCHSTAATYRQSGVMVENNDEGKSISAAASSIGLPTRATCGKCHFNAGGGDNVRTGDLCSNLLAPSPEDDVHMGRLDFQCQGCHKTAGHRIAGSALHLGVADGRVGCTDCHAGVKHQRPILNRHAQRIACQACHVPAFSRTMPTLVYWDWSTAGDETRKVDKDKLGKPIYDKRKGDLVWGQNIRPTLAWWNGKQERMLIGEIFTGTPVALAAPAGDVHDPEAMLYPFKIMKGRQAADSVHKRMLVPHLSGTRAGENPFWEKWDWGKAFAEGMQWAGIEYSGKYEWVETIMYMPINHEVAPKEEALGCNDCHRGGLDFRALGYKGDPIFVGAE